MASSQSAGMILVAVAAFGGEAAAQAARSSSVAQPEIEMTVRSGDGLEAVRITRFTPRMAAAAALDGALDAAAPFAAPPRVLGFSAAWDKPLRSLFGVDATLAFSGAVASDGDGPGSGSASGVALGATISTLGVDLSGHFVHPDGDKEDALSFGASTALGGWTLGGVINLEMDEDGGAGARLGASYLAAPGLMLGGGVDFATADDAAATGGRGGLAGGAAVGAGVSVRLDF